VREHFGDLWEMQADLVCVTTNGETNSAGQAIMGAGIAKDAKLRFKGIARVLGQELRAKGNHVHLLGTWPRDAGLFPEREWTVASFPTKHVWRDPSDLALIEQSARELLALLDQHAFRSCGLPRPGCQNGRLSYRSQVKPVLQRVFEDDDRIVIVARESERGS
jgi:hypothetical protein